MPTRIRLNLTPAANQDAIPVRDVGGVPGLDFGSEPFRSEDGRSLIDPIPAELLEGQSYVTRRGRREDVISFGGGSFVYESEVSAFQSSLSVPLSNRTLLAVNELVSRYKSSGAWEQLDALFLLANETEEASYKDLVNPARSAVKTGNPPWAQWLGSRGTGSSGNFLTCTTLSKMTQADAHFVVCTNQTVTAAQTTFGLIGANSLQYSVQPLGAQEVCNFNNNAFTPVRSSDGGSGVFGATRGNHPIAGAVPRGIFANGTFQIDPGPASVAPSGSVCVHRRNSLYGAARVAVLHYGATLTHEQISVANVAIRNYLSAIGGKGDLI